MQQRRLSKPYEAPQTEQRIPTSAKHTTEPHPDFGILTPHTNLYQNLYCSNLNPPAPKIPTEPDVTIPITFKEYSQIDKFDNLLVELDKKVEDLKRQFKIAAKRVQLGILQGIIHCHHITGIPVSGSILHSTSVVVGSRASDLLKDCLHIFKSVILDRQGYM